MLRSAQKGALEARAASLQLIFRCVNRFPDSLFRRGHPPDAAASEIPRTDELETCRFKVRQVPGRQAPSVDPDNGRDHSVRRAHGSALSERSGPVDSRLDPCRLWPGSPPRRHWQVGGLRAIFIHSSSLADHGAQTCRCPEGSKGDSARQTPGVRGVCLFESEYGVRSWYALRNRNSDWNTQ